MEDKKQSQNKKTKVVDKLFGRPKKKIDKNVFENLMKIQCTKEEICAVLMVSENTLLNWVKENYDGATFCAVFSSFKAVGRASLRRIQYDQAEKNPRMAIWLGKQYLGQRDTDRDKPQDDDPIDEFINAVLNVKKEEKGEEDNGEN
ncbi:MAG: hypothetical protein II988_06715 [Clostridia bacterium]|nr:hypothetical protein [Clostridia bacterium]MBQ3597482.1 hypothetical protein [Clostridia bacterium]